MIAFAALALLWAVIFGIVALVVTEQYADRRHQMKVRREIDALQERIAARYPKQAHEEPERRLAA